ARGRKGDAVTPGSCALAARAVCCRQRLVEREGVLVERAADDGAGHAGDGCEGAQVLQGADAAGGEDGEAGAGRELARGGEVGAGARAVARDVGVKQRCERMAREALRDLERGDGRRLLPPLERDLAVLRV